MSAIRVLVCLLLLSTSCYAGFKIKAGIDEAQLQKDLERLAIKSKSDIESLKGKLIKTGPAGDKYECAYRIEGAGEAYVFVGAYSSNYNGIMGSHTDLQKATQQYDALRAMMSRIVPENTREKEDDNEYYRNTLYYPLGVSDMHLPPLKLMMHIVPNEPFDVIIQVIKAK
jgi:hypothetical protein